MSLIGSLISVVLGWILGQGTTLFRDFRTDRKLKKSLLLELSDIQIQLYRTRLSFQRQIELFSRHKIDPSTQVQIKSYFFDHHYKDVFNKLNRDQRMSYQVIHESLKALNEMTEELRPVTLDCFQTILRNPKDPEIPIKFKLWGDQLNCLYSNARTIEWHIDYHLRNPKRPVLDQMGSTHQSYLKFQESLKGEIETIKRNAQNIKEENLGKIYPNELFEGRDGSA